MDRLIDKSFHLHLKATGVWYVLLCVEFKLEYLCDMIQLDIRVWKKEEGTNWYNTFTLYRTTIKSFQGKEFHHTVAKRS